MRTLLLFDHSQSAFRSHRHGATTNRTVVPLRVHHESLLVEKQIEGRAPAPSERGSVVSQLERGSARRPCPALQPPRTRRRQSLGRERRAALWPCLASS